jgi:uncharacterized protein (DUF849 family)
LPAGALLKLYFATDQGLAIAIEPGLSGSPFGLRPTAIALEAYLELLEGCSLPWAVSIAGGDVVASDMAQLALERGGHLHVGLEFFGGPRTPSNPELVAEAVELCRGAGRPVATPDQAAVILGLPRPVPVA